MKELIKEMRDPMFFVATNFPREFTLCQPITHWFGVVNSRGTALALVFSGPVHVISLSPLTGAKPRMNFNDLPRRLFFQNQTGTIKKKQKQLGAMGFSGWLLSGCQKTRFCWFFAPSSPTYPTERRASRSEFNISFSKVSRSSAT